MRHRWLGRLIQVLVLILTPLLVTAGDWPTYLHDPGRNAGSPDETILSRSNAAKLTLLWKYHTGATVAASPAVVGSTVYIGSWDGYEYALNGSTGALKWKTFLGTTPASTCDNPAVTPPMGITSSATVQNGVLYVGGGDANWYALDAASGQIRWSVFVGDNSATGGHYNWSSPLIYGGYAYVGLASNSDCPMVQGQLLQVSLNSHQVVNTLNVVTSGQVGGGIWTSPSVDPATNTIYVTTGNPENPAQPCDEPLAPSLVALDATTLAVKSWWQIPPAQLNADADWSTTPSVFTDSSGRPLISAGAKNGYWYAFNRNNLAAGPVWQRLVAQGGYSPEGGDGTASSAAVGNGSLYVAGGNTSINGAMYPGSVRALDPGSGNVIWEHGAPGAVIPGLAYANGLVIDAAGSNLEVLNATTGAVMFSYTTGGVIYGAPTVSNGRIFVGSTDGNVYAFGLSTTSSSSATATPPPTSSSAPALSASYSAGNQPPSFPASVAGGSVPYQVSITNTGSSTWTAGGPNPVRLGVHFTATGGGYPTSAQQPWPMDQRFSLPFDVRPGASVTLAVSVVPPASSGTYVLEYQLVKEGVAWFPQYLDANVSVTSFQASYAVSGPSTATACSQAVYRITVTNTGSSTWPGGGSNPVALDTDFAPRGGGYVASQPWTIEQFFYLASDVAPGQSFTYTLALTTPGYGGNYVVEVQMMQLGVGRFAQYSDNSITIAPTTLSLPTNPTATPVQPGTSTPTAVPNRMSRITPTPAASGPPVTTPTPVPGRQHR